jgi:hypothetical protein
MSILPLILAILLVIKSHAEDNHLRGLAGSPFTDPTRIQEMSDSWKKQPIIYDSSAGIADIVVNLDQQMKFAFAPIIQKYAEEHNLKIVVNHGTCGISAGGLSRKSVDIGGFCCPPGVTDRLPGLRFHTLGIAALALLVHPNNPVDNITIEQARKIFKGDIYLWSDVLPAGSDKNTDVKIQPVVRLHCKLRPGHWRLLLENENLFGLNLFEVGAIPDMISMVSINPRAIGYEILWMTRYYKDKGSVKSLKINGYSQDSHSHLISTKYPLYRVYSLTTWEGKNVANPHAQKLINYLLQQVEHIEGKFSFIPASQLRQADWKFKDNELVGEPK